MEKLELLARSQRPLGTPSLIRPTGLGSEGTLPPTVPTLMRSGGIYLKVTRDIEDKKCHGRMTVFSNDAVPILSPTRLRLSLMHQ